MEYVVPAVMFVLGFGGALVIRRMLDRGSFSLRPKQMTVEREGGVRLDTVGKKTKKGRRKGRG